MADGPPDPDPLLTVYAAPPTLRGARVIVRPFRREDVPAVNAYASDPRVTQYVHWAPHDSLLETAGWLDRVMHHAHEHRHLALAIALADAPEHAIGSVGVTSYPGCADEVAVGYVLRSEHWGSGLATEAVRLVVTWLRSTVAPRVVKAIILPENVASRRVAEKVGMRDVRAARSDELPSPACQGARTYVLDA